MNDKITTNIVFCESTELTLNDGTTKTLNARDYGGAANVLIGEANVSKTQFY